MYSKDKITFRTSKLKQEAKDNLELLIEEEGKSGAIINILNDYLTNPETLRKVAEFYANKGSFGTATILYKYIQKK